MTRYCVQITRTYEVDAADEDAAQVEALAEDESEDRRAPTFIVTDLDAIDRATANTKPIAWTCCDIWWSGERSHCGLCERPRGANQPNEKPA